MWSNPGRRQLIGVTVVLLSVASATAQSPREAAKQHFLKGVELFGRGDLSHALPEFEGSYSLNPLPEVLFNIALTQKGLRRYADAIHSFERFRRGAQERPGGLTQKRLGDADRAITEMTSSVAVLMLNVSPSTATVRLDGREPAPVEPMSYLDPGTHRIEVSASGYGTNRYELNAVAGQTMTLSVALHAASPLAAAPPDPAPTAAMPPVAQPAPSSERVGVVRPLASPFHQRPRGKATIALGALSGAFLITAAGLGGSSISLRGEYERSCQPTCDASLYSHGHAVAVAADTFIGLGVASAAAALLAAFVPSPTHNLSLAPTFTARGSAVSLQGAF